MKKNRGTSKTELDLFFTRLSEKFREEEINVRLFGKNHFEAVEPCLSPKELLDYVDNSIDEDGKGKIDNHLAICPDCPKMVEILKEFKENERFSFQAFWEIVKQMSPFTLPKTVDVRRRFVNVISIDLSSESLVANMCVATAKIKVLPNLQDTTDDILKKILVVKDLGNIPDYKSWKIVSKAAGIISDMKTKTAIVDMCRTFKKPCLLGSSNATNILQPYDGRLATLDSKHRKIDIGDIPKIIPGSANP